MKGSEEVLRDHPVNLSRRQAGKKPASSIWLWGHGRKPSMPSFQEKYGISGSVIAAVDLIKGLGRCSGLEIVEVEGATGYLDTNYKGKAEAALESLTRGDFVFLHVEAPDEAGHIGDVEAKIEAIEKFDSLVVGTVLEGLRKWKRYRVLVLPDHRTPIVLKTHSTDPIPFVIYDQSDSVKEDSALSGFDEDSAEKSGVFVSEGWTLVERLVGSE